MGRGPFGIAVVLTCVSGGCAQGDLDANTSFGMTQAGSTADDDDDDDDDDESGDDGGTTGGSDGG